MAGQVTITGFSGTEPAGQRVIGPLTDSGAVTIGETLGVALALGDNTLAVPLGAVAALIVPPVGSATLKLRTSLNAGDTGLPLPATNRALYYPFPAPAPTSLIVNSAATQSTFLTVVFI